MMNLIPSPMNMPRIPKQNDSFSSNDTLSSDQLLSDPTDIFLNQLIDLRYENYMEKIIIKVSYNVNEKPIENEWNFRSLRDICTKDTFSRTLLFKINNCLIKYIRRTEKKILKKTDINSDDIKPFVINSTKKSSPTTVDKTSVPKVELFFQDNKNSEKYNIFQLLTDTYKKEVSLPTPASLQAYRPCSKEASELITVLRNIVIFNDSNFSIFNFLAHPRIFNIYLNNDKPTQLAQAALLNQQPAATSLDRQPAATPLDRQPAASQHKYKRLGMLALMFLHLVQNYQHLEVGPKIKPKPKLTTLEGTFSYTPDRFRNGLSCIASPKNCELFYSLKNDLGTSTFKMKKNSLLPYDIQVKGTSYSRISVENPWIKYGNGMLYPKYNLGSLHKNWKSSLSSLLTQNFLLTAVIVTLIYY